MTTKLETALVAAQSKDRAHALSLMTVSRETLARCEGLVELLTRWQKIKNLVGPSTLEQVWSRHIVDSLQLVALAPEAKTWVDLGSGAGFPGLVIASALADVLGVRVHLVESNGRKVAFLREAARVLALPVTVHDGRIEAVVPTLTSQPVDIVTARALASLTDLIELSAPLLMSGAEALFLKGQDVEGELTQASKSWIIDASVVSSRTDPGGRIVRIRSVERGHPTSEQRSP